jgi:hypothetical protein
MTRTLLAAIFCLATSFAGVAQQAASEAPATKEDIQKYLEVMHSREMLSQMVDAMAKPMHQMIHEQYLKDKDKLPADFEARANKIMDESMKAYPWEEMLQAMVPVYQKHLTKGDVDALIAFYGTSTGQKLLRELPAITAEAMQAMMPLLRKRIDAMNEQVQEEIAHLRKESKGTASDSSQAKPN